MRVYVLRHSIREYPENVEEEEDGDPDAELTPEGREIAEGVAAWMVENEEIPSVIYASLTVRAEQTAQAVIDAIKDAGFAVPDLKSDVSIGPSQSIRGLLLKLGEDKATTGAMIVTHQESIVNGLTALSVDNDGELARKVDKPAMGELRILKVKRKTGAWELKKRVRPSDLALGLSDHY